MEEITDSKLKPIDDILIVFNALYNEPSDINEHLPTLRAIANECSSVAEFGVRGIVSTYAFMLGLAENTDEGHPQKTLFCVDIEDIDMSGMIELGKKVNVDVAFKKCDSVKVIIPEVDLLFIDTWHVYEHLKRELAAHHAKVRKYIVMHDTFVDGRDGESIRLGMDYKYQAEMSGYPIEGICKGLRPAISEFLEEHREWKMVADYQNCNGLTILARV